MSETTELSGLEPGKWTIDPAHSEITFTIRHLMTTVRGSFTEFQGELTISDDVASSSAHAKIEMASIDTRNDERDQHVRTSEILDVANHPVMTFTASGAERARIGRRARTPRYNVEGTLVIRDVARPIQLLAEYHGISVDPWGGTRAGLTATTTIHRSDFGIEFNIPLQGDRVVLGDAIDIQLEIQAVQS